MARPCRSDTLPAAALLVLALVEIGIGAEGEGGGAAAGAAVVVMASLLWRRFAPVLVGLVVAAGLAVTSAAAPRTDVLALLLALVLAAYTVGQQRPLRQAAAGATGMLALVWAAVLTSAEAGGGSLLFTAIAVLVPILAGQALRTAGEQAEREREAEARLAVEQERARIARELHDVVAHGVSLMVLHAGAAQRVIERDPERGKEALNLIERTGRESLQELQRLLGVLRPTSALRSAEPQPGLADVLNLVAQFRAAGTTVRLESEGMERPVPPGIGLAAYRILQEALTNATRHAPEAAVRIGLAVREHEIVVEVEDDGTAASAPSHVDGGHGLVGMRERARMYGGEFHAGPEADGWNVQVRLPLPVT